MDEIEKAEEYTELFNENHLDLLQSWEWGEIKKPEWEPVRVNPNGSEIPVTILTHRIPLLNKKFGYIPRGFSNERFNKDILEQARNFCKDELALTHLIIDPNLKNSSVDLGIFYNAGFSTSGKTIQPNQTNILDLLKSEDELWMGLRASFRRNIKKSGGRFGCKVEQTKDIDRFIKVSEQINTRNKFVKHTPAYFKKAWEIFSNGQGTSAKIFIVTQNDKDIAAYFLAYTGNKAFELYGGVTDEGKPLRAGHLLKWECIKDAKSSGLKLYDQWGVARFIENKEDPKKSDFDNTDELYYISEFKSGFGGEYTEFMPQQTIIFSKFGYNFFRLLQTINSLKLRLLKRG